MLNIEAIKQKLKSMAKDKSYRRKYKYYYALTFVIPIVVILVANVITQEIVKNQVLYSDTYTRDAFFEALGWIRTINYLGILVCIIIGVFVIYKMSRNTYRPLELVLAQLQDDSNQQFDAGEHNEFEFVAKLMRKKEGEVIGSRQQKQKDKEAARRKELMMIALEGRQMNDAELQYLEQELAPSKHFFCGILQLRHCGEVGWDLISFVINNVFEEIFEGMSQCDIISVSGTHHVIVLGAEKELQEAELEGLFLQGINFLKQHIDVFSVVGMGNACQDIYGFSKMYREAQQALEYRFLLGKEEIIRCGDIQGRQIKLPFSEKNVMFHVVDEFFGKEKLEESSVSAFLEQLTQSYGIDIHASMETVAYFRYEILNVLNRVWANNEVEYFQRQTYVEQLMEAGDLEEYLECLSDIIYETGKSLQDNNYKKNLCRRIKQYVEENYTNPELSVSLIGEVFNMQAAYLSQMFREEYGMLLLNYIAHTRIDQAKRLLRESQMTVNEIGESVGFLSGGVFIKTFKKIEGITPGKYRGTGNDGWIVFLDNDYKNEP